MSEPHAFEIGYGIGLRALSNFASGGNGEAAVEPDDKCLRCELVKADPIHDGFGNSDEMINAR